MKLTFCPVDLPEGQSIETLEFNNIQDLQKAAIDKCDLESKKNQHSFVGVIWEEHKGISLEYGEYFTICAYPNIVITSIIKDQIELYGKLKNLNIFCFATFEEAFDYAKDYCQSVWPSKEDVLN